MRCNGSGLIEGKGDGKTSKTLSKGNVQIVGAEGIKVSLVMNLRRCELGLVSFN